MSQAPQKSSSTSGILAAAIVFLVIMQFGDPILKSIFPVPVPDAADKDKKIPPPDRGFVENPPVQEGPNKNPDLPVQEEIVKKEPVIKKPVVVKNEEKIVTLRDDYREMSFSSRAASLQSLKLKLNDKAAIRGRPFEFLKPYSANLPHFALSISGYEDELIARHWQLSEETAKSVTFKLNLSNGIQLSKTFTLTDNYGLDLHVQISGDQLKDLDVTQYGVVGLEFESDASQAISKRGGFFIGERKNKSLAQVDFDFSDIQSRYEDAKGDFKKARIYHSDSDYGIGELSLKCFLLHNQYFTSVLKAPMGDAFDGFCFHVKKKETAPNNAAMALSTKANDTQLDFKIQSYLGPRHEKSLAAFDEGLENTTSSGFFTFLERIMFYIIELFYSMTNSYGLAIIFLTLVVRICIHPLTRFSQTKMQAAQEEMQKLQPKIEKLKKKYEKDKQALARAQMELMKGSSAHSGMMMGCLPMFLQFPIFIALFELLQGFIELRGTSFLMIEDLSLEDQLIFSSYNLLPFLTLAVTVYSMRRGMKRNMSKNPTPEQQAQQKMMMFIMPPFLLIITYTFSSGLLIYWFTSALIGIFETEYIRKRREKLKLASATPALSKK